MGQNPKFQCLLDREFPEFFKTHLTFISRLFYKASRSLWTKAQVLLSGAVHSFNLWHCLSLYIPITCDIVCLCTLLSPAVLSVPVHYYRLRYCLSLYIPFICEIVCPCTFLHLCNGLSLYIPWLMDSDKHTNGWREFYKVTNGMYSGQTLQVHYKVEN